MTLWRHVCRTTEIIPFDRLAWPVIPFAAYLTVEIIAEICRRHLVATFSSQIGVLAPATAAAMAMAWAYLAHGKLAFRRWRIKGRLQGAALFVVVSLAFMDAQLAMGRLGFSSTLLWVIATSLKYGLVRRLIWRGRLGQSEVAA